MYPSSNNFNHRNRYSHERNYNEDRYNNNNNNNNNNSSHRISRTYNNNRYTPYPTPNMNNRRQFTNSFSHEEQRPRGFIDSNNRLRHLREPDEFQEFFKELWYPKSGIVLDHDLFEQVNDMLLNMLNKNPRENLAQLFKGYIDVVHLLFPLENLSKEVLRKFTRYTRCPEKMLHYLFKQHGSLEYLVTELLLKYKNVNPTWGSLAMLLFTHKHLTSGDAEVKKNLICAINKEFIAMSSSKYLNFNFNSAELDTLYETSNDKQRLIDFLILNSSNKNSSSITKASMLMWLISNGHIEKNPKDLEKIESYLLDALSPHHIRPLVSQLSENNVSLDLSVEFYKRFFNAKTLNDDLLDKRKSKEQFFILGAKLNFTKFVKEKNLLSKDETDQFIKVLQKNIYDIFKYANRNVRMLKAYTKAYSLHSNLIDWSSTFPFIQDVTVDSVYPDVALRILNNPKALEALSEKQINHLKEAIKGRENLLNIAYPHDTIDSLEEDTESSNITITEITTDIIDNAAAQETNIQSPPTESLLEAHSQIDLTAYRQHQPLNAAAQIIKLAMLSNPKFLDELKASNGSWKQLRELFRWDAIRKDVTDEYLKHGKVQLDIKIGTTNLASCLYRLFNSPYSPSTDVVADFESYALFLAKLEEAKWRVWCNTNKIEPIIETADSKKPALIIYEKNQSFYVSSRMVQFDQEGFLIGFCETGTKDEDDLLMDLGLQKDSPVDVHTLEYLKKQIYTGNDLQKNSKGLPYLVLSSIDADKSRTKRPVLDLLLQPHPSEKKSQPRVIKKDTLHWATKSKEAVHEVITQTITTVPVIEPLTHPDPLPNLQPEIELHPLDSHSIIPLKPYQQANVQFLNKLRTINLKGGICSDQMGLGKTVTAASWVFNDWQNNEKDFLFVSPKSVRNQNLKTFRKYWKEFQFEYLKGKMQALDSALTTKKLTKEHSKEMYSFKNKGIEVLKQHYDRKQKKIEKNKREALYVLYDIEKKLPEIKQLEKQKARAKNEIAKIQEKNPYLIVHNNSDQEKIDFYEDNINRIETRIKNYRNINFLRGKINESIEEINKGNSEKKDELKVLKQLLRAVKAYRKVQSQYSVLEQEALQNSQLSIKIDMHNNELKKTPAGKKQAEQPYKIDKLFYDLHDILISPGDISSFKYVLEEHCGKTQPPSVIFTTPQQLKKVKQQLQDAKFANMIVDEAHLARDPSSSLAISLKNINRDFTTLFTGTPYCNTVRDLFALMGLLDMVDAKQTEQYLQDLDDASIELLNRVLRLNPLKDSADKTYTTQSRKNVDLYRKLKPLYKRTQEFKALLQTAHIRHERTDQEVANAWDGKIATKKVKTISCPLTSVQKRLLSEESEPQNFFNKIWRHQRILLHPDLAENADVLNELIKEDNPKKILKWMQKSGVLSRIIKGEELKQAVESRQPTILYADQVNTCRLLKAAIEAQFKLKDEDVLLYTGAIASEKKRNDIIDRFKRAPDHKPRIMVLTRGAGGVGLDLNAKHVFIIERQFEPFEDKQLEDRSVRVNQTGEVQIWYPCSDTKMEKHQHFVRSLKEIQSDYFISKGKEGQISQQDDFKQFLDMVYAERIFDQDRILDEKSWNDLRQSLVELFKTEHGLASDPMDIDEEYESDELI